MDFASQVSLFINAHELLHHNEPVLVAVSGGADSVALLHVLVSLGFDCAAAHCNFELRGAESQRDEDFVKQLCEQQGIPLFTRHFDAKGKAAQEHISLEMACRNLRYDWFEHLLDEHGFQAVAVAHHIDDNIETFFLNALRGSGIAGLAAMRPKNGRVVRPLLGVTRLQVLSFLDKTKQQYVTDSTNAQNNFLRNRLRNVVLPTLYEHFPQAKTTLASTIDHTAASNALYRELINDAATALVTRHDDALIISCDKLMRYRNATTLLLELSRPGGFNHSQCSDVIAAIKDGQSTGKKWLSPTHQLSLNRGNIEIFKLKEKLEETHDINLLTNLIENPITIKIGTQNNAPFTPAMCDGRRVVAFNAQVLKAHHVTLRRWQEGDRFKPFGLKGTKLVSDFFVDAKMGEMEKRDTWLLEADGIILWIVGHRAADAFRVEPGCVDYVLLSLEAPC